MATAPANDMGEAEAKYVPEGYKDEWEFLSEMREQRRLDVEADKHNRDAAIDDLKFASGDQWDSTVKEYRKDLPCLTINTLPQYIGQLVGERRLNQVSIKVMPQEDGDKDIAAIRSDLIRNIEGQSRANRVYSSAFEDAVTCSIGNFQVELDYAGDDVFDQDIFIRQIANPLGVVWDRMSVDPTGRDARRCWVDDTIERREFERKWPDAKPGDIGADLESECIKDGWYDAETVTISAYWQLKERDVELALLGDGKIVDRKEVLAPELITQTRKVRRRYACRHLVTGHAILEGPYELPISRIPVFRVLGREVRVGTRRVRFGLIRFAKDPQRLKNFWRSLAAEGLGYSTKAQWLAGASAVEGRQVDFRNSHLNRDTLLVWNDKNPATKEPRRVDPPAPQAALLNEAALNNQDMKDVTGLHDASLGIRSNETSGKAIMARQREGDVATVIYHDNMNAAIEECGSVVNQLIPFVYDATRTIRVVGEDEQARLQRINDPMDPKSVDLSKGKYDVTIAAGASYTTRREEAREGMMEFLRVAPMAGERTADLVAKAQDWPMAEEFAKRLRPAGFEEEEEDGPQIPPELMQQIQQGMQLIQQLQAENAELQKGQAAEQRKLDIDAYNAETNRLKAVADAIGPEAAQAVALKVVLDATNSPDIYPG